MGARSQLVSLSALLMGFLFFFGLGTVHSEEYSSVKGPCELTFPRDHGAHPGYLTEWWYYTGNLANNSSRRYGFQLTFFRTRLVPPGAEETWPSPPSAWRTDQVFFGHVALSDLHGKVFYHSEQMARGALGLAGVGQKNGLTSIFLGRWSATLVLSEHTLEASADHFSFDLKCRPEKAPVLHGREGYSLKGKNRESASCYYSFTRLEARGTLTMSGHPEMVQGTAWMDHEFSSAPLEEDLVGWDWFSIQLGDNTELMIYFLRRRTEGFSEASSGTFVRSSGEAVHLVHQDFKMEVLDFWKSPHSGATYPSRWRIRVIPLDLELMIVPNLADQELITTKSTRVTYWEGSVTVTGKSRERPVEGVGYVELTGYAEPFNLSPAP